MIDREIDYSLRWKWAYIPEALRGLTLDDWTTPTAGHHQVLQIARTFVDTLPARLGRHTGDTPNRALVGVGMSLIGNAGTGKTRLAAAILTTAHLQHGVRICFVRADTYVSASVVAGLTPTTEDEAQRKNRAEMLLSRVTASRLLALDDLGKEHKTASAFAARKINTLLRTRYDAAKPTLVMSNDPIQKWAIYDDALPSFAAQALPTVQLLGADFRRQNGATR